MADRYAYLPFIGLFIMICWGVPDLVARSNVPRACLVAASCSVLVVLGVVAHRQLGYWSDNVMLWSRVSQVIGPNLISEERTGDELMKRGESEAAVEHLRRAVAIKPTDADSNFALGVYEQKHGQLSEAIQRYQVVAVEAPDVEMRVRALTFMSYAYRDLGDAGRARESMQAAERLRR
jgi:tetratricopeptide (TPR) repeat protein